MWMKNCFTTQVYSKFELPDFIAPQPRLTSKEDVIGSLVMETIWKTILWQQFGAAIDMLENGINACPSELWHVRLWDNHSATTDSSEFWYIVYHTLFWLDLYLSGSIEGFVPPVPFTLDELDPAGVFPERPYTKDELQTYLEHGRQSVRRRLKS